MAGGDVIFLRQQATSQMSNIMWNHVDDCLPNAVFLQEANKKNIKLKSQSQSRVDIESEKERKVKVIYRNKLVEGRKKSEG